ncbi:hypothetical protein TNCV_4293781 [Trichonephila clavipes]|uniref:Uncharacterized protein n=1 Tax=Trichonephila clavipes TaxID=2585209 RepID=A0A8X6V067_TRICX|nr:hypothetical protein TNCV_4293781 [Trichonephila clavipes]
MELKYESVGSEIRCCSHHWIEVQNYEGRRNCPHETSKTDGSSLSAGQSVVVINANGTEWDKTARTRGPSLPLIPGHVLRAWEKRNQRTDERFASMGCSPQCASLSGTREIQSSLLLMRVKRECDTVYHMLQK